MAERHPEQAAALGADKEEAAGWRDAAKAMSVPYVNALGLHEQSAGYTSLDVWDFADTPRELYPLMLHFPYFDLYRKQVVKQADLVLAMYLCGDAFEADQKARNFAYYEPLTVRDSSLSACVQCVMAAEVGHVRLAFDYLGEAALMDLADLEKNTRDGLHIASLAGTWVGLVAGFGGMRDHGDVLHFAPRLPERLSRLAFSVLIRQRCLRVDITDSQVTYTLGMAIRCGSATAARSSPCPRARPRPAPSSHRPPCPSPPNPGQTPEPRR
ncbi:hypothetical protein GCM10017744_027280 [Streptomyces antimycoticus]